MGSNKRDSKDGFNGNYPPSMGSAEKAYRDLGLTPPWLLEYEDGKVVGPKERGDDPAPRHEA